MDPQWDDVLGRARAGDAAAFRALMEGVFPELLRFVRVRLRRHGAGAEDVMQEVLMEAWEAMPSFTTHDHLRAWCYRVARCRSSSWLRREVRRGARHRRAACALLGARDAEPAALPGPDAGLAGRPSLPGLLGELPEDVRTPLYLHYVAGQSTRSTAELLGLTYPAARMRLRRGRMLLRGLLASHGLAAPFRRARARAAPASPSGAPARSRAARRPAAVRSRRRAPGPVEPGRPTRARRATRATRRGAR